jgi:hypothetical protein
MTIRTVIHTGFRNACRSLRWGPVVVATVLLGCASTETARNEPTPRDDFREYRQIVVLAMRQVDGVLRALDEVSVQASRDPRPAYEAFAKAVHRLEVDSIKVRARAQAMRARGAAYYEHWENYLATVKNEEVRRLAQEHRAELRTSFEQARSSAQEVRELFRPFLSDLQKLRGGLEASPTLARIDSEKSLILSAKAKGREVEEDLDRILAEMNSMVALLTPPGTAPKH